MKRNNMHRSFAGLLAAVTVMCAAVIGWAAAEPSTEQTKQVETEAEPLVINTVESGDSMLLTVIRGNGETIFQYEGNVELWKGADGKAYGIIYLDEEVCR